MEYKHKRFLAVAVMGVLLAWGLSSCDKGYKTPHPDISQVPEQQVSIVRIEQLLHDADTSNYASVYDEMQKKYPDIYNSLTENFWGLVESDSMSRQQIYDSLYRNTSGNVWMQRLFDSVMLVYTDLDDVEKDISQAYRYFKYYFPDSSLPQLYSYIGPFVYWTIFDSATLGIELDMYLGKHFGYYGSYESNMPQYISLRCDKPYIAVNVMQSLVDGMVPSLGPNGTLLDEMLRQGKILYYLDCVMPDVEDSIKIGFASGKVEWCYDNEGEIWKFLAGEDLLFSTRTDDHRRYLGEAPSSMNMPDDSPGRAAVWSGWQIVRSYMEEHPKTTLQQLFFEMDGMRLLKESNYDPGE